MKKPFFLLLILPLIACSSKEVAQPTGALSAPDVTMAPAEAAPKKAPRSIEVPLLDRKNKNVGLVKISEVDNGVMVTFESKFLSNGNYELVKGSKCFHDPESSSALTKKVKVLGEFSSGGGSLYSEHKVEKLYLDKMGADNLDGENLNLRRVTKDHKETIGCKKVDVSAASNSEKASDAPVVH